MKNIQLVVFDLAGTTVNDNNDVHKVLQYALKDSGVAISIEDANLVMGIPKPVAIKQLLEKKKYSVITEELIAAIHHTFVERMIAFYKTDPNVTEKPGVSDTFRTLKARGIKVAIDTGFDRVITNAVLERMGWLKEGLIDASVTSDEVAKGRPYPDLIYSIMKQLGINDTSTVAKVGDTASDLQEGTAAACGLVVGITTGAFTKEQLVNEPHTHLIDNIQEIITILDTN
jgi:phosphonatase-like hydrolase